tara:strand:- start:634 stop:1236 length:603 start_codon:yes stop_codon:yes gene_type:complete
MFIIGVTGGTGSGKTTTIKKIERDFGFKQICFLSSDSYYKDNSNLDFKKRDQLNYDIPEAIDFDLLNSHVSILKEGMNINVPDYCFSTHLRLKKTKIMSPKKILILEGILIMTNDELRNKIDYSVFLDCSRDLRFKRRLERDVKERNRELSDVINLFKNRLDQMHETYVEPVKKYCNIILDTTDKTNLSELTRVIKEKIL